MARTLLLVDDESNIINALTRLFRPAGYEVLSASGGEAGLVLMQRREVGVIISDQRMPGMTGVEFLSRVKELYPDTVRLILSGYTDLQYITDAINRGAIYRFLTKPWDDDLLLANVEEAFRHHELKRENARLTVELKAANEELEQINRGLEQRVEEKTREVVRNLRVLRLAQEVLEELSVAVLGVSDDGLIAIANREAHACLGRADGSLVGEEAAAVLPEELAAFCRAPHGHDAGGVVELAGGRFAVHYGRLGRTSRAHGALLVLLPEK